MAGAKNEWGLTAKQEAFCHEYLKERNATKAYREVYTTDNMSSKTINEEACRLLACPKISARLDMIRAETERQIKVDVAYLSAELLDAARDAAADKNHSARVAALTNLGKLHGIFVEKQHNLNEDVGKSHLETLREMIDRAENVERLNTADSEPDAADMVKTGTND